MEEGSFGYFGVCEFELVGKEREGRKEGGGRRRTGWEFGEFLTF